MTQRHEPVPEDFFVPLDNVRAQAGFDCQNLESACHSHEDHSCMLVEQQNSNVNRHENLMNLLANGPVRSDVNAIIASHRYEESKLLAEVIEPLIADRVETIGVCTRDQEWCDSISSGPDAMIVAIASALDRYENVVEEQSKLRKRQASLESVVESFEQWVSEISS